MIHDSVFSFLLIEGEGEEEGVCRSLSVDPLKG